MVNGYSNNIQQAPLSASQIATSQAQPAPLQAVQPSASQASPMQLQTVAPNVASNPINPSAVSINIISPSVYGAQNQAPIPYVPIYSYPQAQTVPPPVQATATATATANAAPTPAPEPPKADKKTKQKNVVPLTDEYIMTLESYLNSPNKDTRVMGAKQVMSRFKDDDSRKRDAALTALLNKSLKDQTDDVRLVGMTALASGYAAGDDTTVALLQRIQADKTNYNEDALLASQALAKMAEQANAQKIQVPEN